MEFYQDEEDEFEGEDAGLEEVLGLLTDELEAVVASTVVQRAAEPANVFAARVMDTDLAVGQNVGDTDLGESGMPGLSMAFAILAGWLAAAREELADPQMADKVLAWVGASLGPDCARASGRAAGILGADTTGGLTVQELADELQAEFLPVLIWLTAGVVVEYGNSDVRWLHRGEDDDGPDVVEG